MEAFFKRKLGPSGESASAHTPAKVAEQRAATQNAWSNSAPRPANHEPPSTSPARPVFKMKRTGGAFPPGIGPATKFSGSRLSLDATTAPKPAPRIPVNAQQRQRHLLEGFPTGPRVESDIRTDRRSETPSARIVGGGNASDVKKPQPGNASLVMENGKAASTNGALLPKGYQKANSRETPWICPIRSCRVMTSELLGLGRHFNSHRAVCLNDNLDGTLTIVGEYDDPRPGNGLASGGSYKPAIIVSKRAMSLAEAPLAEPKTTTKAAMFKTAPTLTQAKVEDSDDSWGYEPPRSTQDRVRRNSTRTANESHKPSQNNVNAIKSAPSGRQYDQWPDESTEVLKGLSGALLPDGYELETNYPERPWICPIRPCRKTFGSTKTLGIHWTAMHTGDHLNDNLDGTFSVVKYGRKGDKAPGTVVSQGRNTSDPVVTTQCPILSNTGSALRWVDLGSIDAATGDKSISNTRRRRSRFTDIQQQSASRQDSAAVDTSEGILIAAPGRLYSEWPDPETGKLVHYEGLLLPKHYTLQGRDVHPNLPWICPVRSCRALHETPQLLAKHLGASHQGNTLNDNRNGTLSIVGTHKGPAPIVVSKRPLDPSEDPISYPRFKHNGEWVLCKLPPDYKEAEPSSGSEGESNDSGGEEPEVELRYLDGDPVGWQLQDDDQKNNGEDPNGTWSHICAVVGHNLPLPKPSKYTKMLLQMSRLRPLRLRRQLQPALDDRQRMALIVQVVGLSRRKSCTHCRRNGPLDCCVSLPIEVGEKMADVLKSCKVACACCLVDKVPYSCSVKSLRNPTFDVAEEDEQAGGKEVHGAVAAHRRSGRLRQADEGEEGDDEHDKPPTRPRKRRRRTVNGRYASGAAEEVDEEEPEPKRKLVTVKVAPAAAHSARPSRQHTLGDPASLAGAKERYKVSTAPKSRRISGMAVYSQGTLPNAREISGDGREQIDDEGEDGEDQEPNTSQAGLMNPAAHHASAQRLQLPNNVSMYTAFIASGSSTRYDADPRATRVFTLINGQLKVRIADEEFVIGVGGQFRIDAGVRCTVLNRYYTDAMLQIMTCH
ncbi:hypothetical protein OQA88_2662 [Cercophora sp. LCS_1]